MNEAAQGTVLSAIKDMDRALLQPMINYSSSRIRAAVAGRVSGAIPPGVMGDFEQNLDRELVRSLAVRHHIGLISQRRCFSFYTEESSCYTSRR